MGICDIFMLCLYSIWSLKVSINCIVKKSDCYIIQNSSFCVPQMKQEKFQHWLLWPLVVFSHPSAVYSSVVSICSCHDSLEKVTHLMTCEWYLLNINQFLSIQGDEFIFSSCHSFAFSPTPLICGIWDQPLHCTQPPVARCSISLYFCSELWCSPRCSSASALCSQISLRLISPPAVKTTHNLAPHTTTLFVPACFIYIHAWKEGDSPNDKYAKASPWVALFPFVASSFMYCVP